jgi:RNA-binding protein YhbY
MWEEDPTRSRFCEALRMSDNIPRRIANAAKSENLEVSVRIGRGGVTESFLFELSDQLSRKRLVKVKANKGTTPDREQRRSLFSEIAQLTTSTLVFQRGNVAVFWSGK